MVEVLRVLEVGVEAELESMVVMEMVASVV